MPTTTFHGTLPNYKAPAIPRRTRRMAEDFVSIHVPINLRTYLRTLPKRLEPSFSRSQDALRFHCRGPYGFMWPSRSDSAECPLAMGTRRSIIVKPHNGLSIDSGAFIRVVWACFAHDISSFCNTVMTSCLTNFELLSAAFCFAGPVPVSVVGVSTDVTDAFDSRSSRHCDVDERLAARARKVSILQDPEHRYHKLTSVVQACSRGSLTLWFGVTVTLILDQAIDDIERGSFPSVQAFQRGRMTWTGTSASFEACLWYINDDQRQLWYQAWSSTASVCNGTAPSCDNKGVACNSGAIILV